MQIVQSDALTEAYLTGLSDRERNHIYNALDCCVTFEVLENLLPQLNPKTSYIYRLSRELQGPVLEMELRGLKVDVAARGALIQSMEKTLLRVRHNLSVLLKGMLGLENFNPASPLQVKDLLYYRLGLPVQYKKRKVTTERASLEKLLTLDFFTQPLILHLLCIADIAKRLGTVKSRLSKEGRIHTSFGIAGTVTGRFSSYESPWDDGSNLQNWEVQIRRIVIADPGMKLAYVDLKTAESIALGARCWNLFHDAPDATGMPMGERAGCYLTATLSTDVHTSVARACWPTMPWTGDAAKDRALAENTKVHRDHDYRHVAKMAGHATNLYGQPPELSKRFHLPVKVMEDFQADYFRGFPELKMYHTWCAERLHVHGNDTSLMGRPRWFFGRRDSSETLKEFICYSQQETVCHILSLGILKLWRARICQIHLQVHDALLIQYPEEKEDEIIPQVQAYLATPVQLLYNRSFTIPTTVATGFNWGKWNGEKNPNGLKDYIGHDDRKRSSTNFMDRMI